MSLDVDETKTATSGGETPIEKSQRHDAELAIESDSDAQIQCPPHTTERKLVAKIDLHVIPFLCIMYLLAFLGVYCAFSLPMALQV